MHDDCSLVVGTLKHEICFFREEMEFLKRERERERERKLGVNGVISSLSEKTVNLI
jgi:hypothetical protein